MKLPILRACGLFVFASAALHAQIPQIINYQGRVAVGSINFDGSGAFKFALVNATGSTTYWSNNGSSSAGSQPTAAVSLTVTKGLYSVLLGDTTLTNMTAIPSSVFANTDVRLRVWFNDGSNGSQLLTPDQRLAAVGYAMNAGTLQPGAAISASTLNVSGTTRVGDNISSATPKLILFGDATYVSIGENTADDQMELIANTFVFKSAIGSGNVGIGVLTPNAKLDVAGTVKATAFSGNGSGLTGVVPADGSVSSAKLASNLSLGGTTTGTFSGNGSGLTGVVLADGSVSSAKLASNLSLGGTTTGTFSGNGSGLTGVVVPLADGSVSSAKLASNLSLGGTTTGTFSGDGSGLTNLPSANAESPANVFPARGMAWIKPGSFLMGSRVDGPEDNANETQHPVTLTKGFWIGVHEVTQAEYLAVMGSNPSYFQSPNVTADTSRPVEQVDWNSAVAYCAALTTSERTAGRIPASWGYRLPTEAEWEYCCRAGARTTQFSYDDDLNATALGNYAWYYKDESDILTHPVGQKLSNPWGLMDMHGNVFEWCQDWFDSYPSTSVTDPLGPISGSFRVARGGCYTYTSEDARCAARFICPLFLDNEGLIHFMADFIGFRAVLAPVQ